MVELSEKFECPPDYEIVLIKGRKNSRGIWVNDVQYCKPKKK
jgi:hypothetical protein